MIKVIGALLAAGVALAVPASAAAPGTQIAVRAHGGSAARLALARPATLQLGAVSPLPRDGAAGGVVVTDASGRIRYAALLVKAAGFPDPVSVPLIDRQPLERGSYTVTLLGASSDAVLRADGLRRSISLAADRASAARLVRLAALASSPVWSEPIAVPAGDGIAVLLESDTGPGSLSTQTMCLRRMPSPQCPQPDAVGARVDMDGPAQGIATSHAHLAWNVFAEHRLERGPAQFDGLAGTGTATHTALWIAVH